jgi:hypothetical protein
MREEEKQLLLKDICARLPYGVKIKYLPDNRLDGIVLPYLYNGLTVLQKGNINYRAHIKNIRPYLRSMSSMTEDEKKQFFKLKQMSVTVIVPNVNRLKIEYIVDLEDDGDGLNHLYDWLNAHHFDYRDLIPMGLALEAPENMYTQK